jgi:DNA oxidative demethylase
MTMTRARSLAARLLEPPLLPRPALERFASEAVLLAGFAESEALQLLEALECTVLPRAPWRHMMTPGGAAMSVAMSNCGAVGWVSDRRGYRYEACDPESGAAWPPMPEALRALGERAASAAGFPGFAPDACLINCYRPGTRLSLHQDRNERDFQAPVVSVSLGLPALFLFGGAQRRAPTQRIPLFHGDVVVWGGAQRLAFHGVAPLADGEHPLIGCRRLNLTLRQAR